MCTIFERLKSIAVPTKDLINGYIRHCQHELFGDMAIKNPYYNIPQLINNHCMLFYEVWKWYRKHHGKGLKFNSDTEVTADWHHSWNTCMLEKTISNAFCNKFSITFKVKTDGGPCDVYIGYATGDTLETSILNWNQLLGDGENSSTSYAWDIWNDELYFTGGGQEPECVSNDIEGVISYSEGDLFKLVFDFRRKEVTIYHNSKEMDYNDLKATKLWVGVSIYNDTIEMVKYEYD